MPLDTFGSGVTHPADISYRGLVLTADLTLQWPALSTSSDDVTARIMDVEPQTSGHSITLPDATMVSQGQDVLFRNTGDESFTVRDASGNSIATVSAGQVKFFYLTNNTSAAGVWGVVQFGVGSSSADASLLAGLGLKAIGTTLNQMYQVVETTSDINIGSPDRARLYAYTGGSHTVSLPTSSSVGSDFFFLLKNGGAGTVTVEPAGSDTIDGSSSLLVQPNDGVIIYSAGSSDKWYTVALGRSVQFAFTQLVKDVGGATEDITLTSSEAQNKVITFTGTLVQSINVVVPDTVSVYYVFNNTSGSFSLTVRTAEGSGVAVTQGAREICVCDGADVRRGVDNTSATTLFSQGSETSPSITFVTDPDTGMYHPAANEVGITAGGVDVMRFSGVSGGVNTFNALAAATGDPVKLTVIGDDSNASMIFKAKGSGNVIFEDVDYLIRNSADDTKAVIFDCSGITTDNTRTVTFADADGEMVLDGATQTLTNKTLDSVVFSGDEPVESVDVVGNVVMCPVGAVIPFAGSTAPDGWLLCDGSAVSRSDYARLYAVISTTYGTGDGSTTFNVPDMQGRVAVGKDDMSGTAAGRITSGGSGLDGTTLGADGGEETHELTSAENGPHVHTITDPGHAHTTTFDLQNLSGGSAPNILVTPGFGVGQTGVGSSSNPTNISINTSGSGDGHNNVQPSLILNYIIKC